MADPHHVEVLDPLDRLTVRLYRSGLTLAALGLILSALTLLLSPEWLRAALLLTTAGASLAVLDMHLYSKHVRWVIALSLHLGVLLTLLCGLLTAGAAWWVFHAGLGFVFVALSGFALKERLCFRIPGLVMVPALLAGSLIPLLGAWPWPAAGLLGAAGGIYLTLCVAKWRMPLHFDVGDKSAYQV